MNRRNYFSVRTSKTTKNIGLEVLKKMFLTIYDKLSDEGHFQKYFGYHCNSREFVRGELGNDISGMIFIHLKKDNLYPIHGNIDDYTEGDLFDIIEFLHDHCSIGIDGYCCSSCPPEYDWHYTNFDDIVGQKYFRELVNPLLEIYDNKCELSENGEILNLADFGLSHIFNEYIPTDEEEKIKVRIEKAVLQFRRHKSTIHDKRDAIKELAGVLEYIRPNIKKYLVRKDDSALFTIANEFGIRHHNKMQHTDYDETWLNWIFHFFLATLYTVLKIMDKNK